MTRRDVNGIDLTGITPREQMPPNPFDTDQTRADRKAGLCTECRQPQPDAVRATWSVGGQREWYISSCCEPCFDRMFPDE